MTGWGSSISLEQAERGLAAEIAFYRAHMLEGRDAASVAGLHAQCAQALMGRDPSGPRRPIRTPLTEALLASLRFPALADAAPALGGARRRVECVVVVCNWDASLPATLSLPVWARWWTWW